MAKDWREGNLTALNCGGEWRSDWVTGSFLLVSDKPCYQHSVTGKLAYFAMAEVKDKYRIYVVHVGVDGSQDGFCSPYCDLTPEENMTLVNRWEWAVKEFNEVYEECAEMHRTLYPQYHVIANNQPLPQE